MSRYDPWVLAGVKLEEYKDDRNIDEMTWIEAERTAEAYEELEERIQDVAQGIADVLQDTLENSCQWQIDSVLINNEDDPFEIVEKKMVQATLKELLSRYTESN